MRRTCAGHQELVSAEKPRRCLGRARNQERIPRPGPIVVDGARQQGFKITKSDFAIRLPELILAEMSEVKSEPQIVERRPVVGLALGIGRYSM